MKEFQSHIIAAAGTLFLLLLLFLLLTKVSMHAPIQLEDEGIVITFGNADEGGGMPDVIPIDPIVQAEQTPAEPAPAQPSNNDLIVQEDEESLALAQQNEEELKQHNDAELLRQKKEAEAQAEAERIAKEKALAEQKAREEAIKKAQMAVAMFGQAGATTGANAANATSTPASTNKGNPVGKSFGQVDGNMWSLQGRSVKAMPKPASDFKEQGKVVISIRVDKQGNVVAASIGDGTTISDRYTQQLARDAALKAKFTEGDNEQIGSITYNFKLN